MRAFQAEPAGSARAKDVRFNTLEGR